MKKIHHFASIVSVTLVLTVLTSYFTACSTSPKSTSATTDALTVAKVAGEISVMQFNVENLFDNIHDEGTEDYPYLPLSEKSKPAAKKFCSEIKSAFYKSECFEKDWSDEQVKFKLAQVAKTIRFVDNGQGPDNLLMEEVENIRILNRLVQEELKGLGYQTVVLIEGPDLRGIDPAFISKFPMLGKPQLHIIPYKDADAEKLKYAKRSRGILEVTVELPNKKPLTFLVGHFPSQSNPTEWRKQAVEFATNLMKTYEAQGRAVISGGDFNIIAEEERDSGYFAKTFSRAGKVSHLVGCASCEGSHNYKGQWSFLDALVFGNSLDKAAVSLIADSIHIVRAPHHTKRNGAPLGFRAEKGEGVSDHFPLYARLKLMDQKK